MDDKNMTGEPGDLVLDLRALFDARWVSAKRARHLAYAAADEIEILRKRQAALEAEVYAWRYVVGPGWEATDVDLMIREKLGSRPVHLDFSERRD